MPCRQMTEASAWGRQPWRRFSRREAFNSHARTLDCHEHRGDGAGGSRIPRYPDLAVGLTLGALTGIAKEALLSCYALASTGTPIAGSRLVVDEVPVIVFCPKCRGPRPLDSLQLFACPECGSPTTQVLQGKELEVVALEVAE